MDDQRLGRLVRVLRQRRGWRQVDLAHRAGSTQSVISALERGRAGGMTVNSVRRIGSVFGASVELSIRGLGAEVDRLLDEQHAGLVGAALRLLVDSGYDVRPEVSYSEWGERGSIDLLGWHEPTRSLLVIEVKSELASVEETLRKHDIKVRLGPAIASKRFGWRAVTVHRILVLPATRTSHRHLATHVSVMNAAYPARGRQVLAGSGGQAGGAASGILFVPDIAEGRGRAALTRRKRVQLPRVASQPRIRERIVRTEAYVEPPSGET
jgi:transcriptional regulator with XRE-family HTH domain